MPCPRWLLFAILALSAGSALGAEPLSAAQIAQAVRLESLSVPTPGELFAAINKQGQPVWQSHYRPPISTSYTSRAQIALNLGGLIADGYIGVEATDSQQVKNVAKDILALAKPLGVSQNILARGNSLMEFADHNEWNTLKEELEATQNEVERSMEEQGDSELVILVSLGGWIRGTEVISSWIAENHTPEAAKLLRQPALVAFLRGKTAGLSEKTQDDSVVKSVRRKLETIEQLVTFPRDQSPGVEEVKRIQATATELVADISRKE